MNFFIRRLHFIAKIKQLREKREALSNAISDMLEKAEAENWARDDRESERQFMYDDVRWVDDEIAVLITRYWVNEADHLIVPVPSTREDGMWEEAPKSNRLLLTNSGVDRVRKAVREERKALLDPWKQVGATIFSIASVIVGWLLGKVS